MSGGSNPTTDARRRSRFDEFQRRLVHQATTESSVHLNRFYRYAPREFFNFSYDVLTERDIPPSSFKEDVFAETISYTHGSTPKDFYRIHLFDHPILVAVSTRTNAPALYPFLLYILTHELIHISRLSRLGLENPTEEERVREEETVHRLTRDVLAPESSFPLEQVADLYHLNLLP
jgi:hypothetical protein